MPFTSQEPHHIMQLISEALSDREKKREQVRVVEDMALGPYSDTPNNAERPENLAFATAALLLPSMVQNAPRCSIVSHGGVRERLLATAVQGAVNQVARQSSMHRTLRPAAWDYLMGWCVAFVEEAPTNRSDPTDEERAGMTGALQAGIATPAGPSDPSVRVRPEWPRVSYLHPDRFFFDTKARTIAAWEFCGHSNVESIDAIKERAKADPDTWYTSEVNQLMSIQDGEMLGYAMHHERITDRNKTVYYVIYEPGGQIEGEKPGPWDYGVIHTISPVVSRESSGSPSLSDGVRLRPPFYYTGHPHGPYAFAGQYTHTQDAFPFTALLANMHSVEMLNAVASSLHDRIRKHSVKFAYDLRHSESIEELQNAPDGAWVGIANLQEAQIVPIETGAPTAAEVRELGLLQARAAANLALDDAVRGRVDPDATATAIQQVAATTQARTSFLLDGWRQFVTDVFERMAASVVRNERFFLRLDDDGRDEYRRAVIEAALPRLQEQLGIQLTGADTDDMLRRSRPVAVPFVGGDLKEDAFAWWDLQFEVNPDSMEGDASTNSAIRQQAIDGLLQFYAQGMITAPHVNWKERARQHFTAIGAPGAERLLDEERASTLVGMQLMGVEPQPRAGGMMGGTAKQPQVQGNVSAGGGERSPDVPEE